MIELTAAQVAAATGGRLHADPDVTVTGTVVIDSRDAAPGALFVALRGERLDGPTDPRVGQQVGDQGLHPLRAVDDKPNQLRRLLIHRALEALGEELDEVGDGA